MMAFEMMGEVLRYRLGLMPAERATLWAAFLLSSSNGGDYPLRDVDLLISAIEVVKELCVEAKFA